ncbi:hypothetical protein [Modestobacter sp. SYSU DS0290]
MSRAELSECGRRPAPGRRQWRSRLLAAAFLGAGVYAGLTVTAEVARADGTAGGTASEQAETTPSAPDHAESTSPGAPGAPAVPPSGVDAPTPTAPHPEGDEAPPDELVESSPSVVDPVVSATVVAVPDPSGEQPLTDAGTPPTATPSAPAASPEEPATTPSTGAPTRAVPAADGTTSPSTTSPSTASPSTASPSTAGTVTVPTDAPTTTAPTAAHPTAGGSSAATRPGTSPVELVAVGRTTTGTAATPAATGATATTTPSTASSASTASAGSTPATGGTDAIGALPTGPGPCQALAVTRPGLTPTAATEAGRQRVRGATPVASPSPGSRVAVMAPAGTALDLTRYLGAPSGARQFPGQPSDAPRTPAPLPNPTLITTVGTCSGVGMTTSTSHSSGPAATLAASVQAAFSAALQARASAGADAVVSPADDPGSRPD